LDRSEGGVIEMSEKQQQRKKEINISIPNRNEGIPHQREKDDGRIIQKRRFKGEGKKRLGKFFSNLKRL